MRRRILICSSVFFLLVFVAILLTISKRTREMKITLMFVGYTNETGGVRSAQFRFVNDGNVKTRILRQYLVETERQSKLYPTARFLRHNLVLDPSKSETVLIPVVTYHGAWCASFYYHHDGSRAKIADWMGPLRLNDPRWKQVLRIKFNPTHQLIRSEWMEGEPKN